MTQRRLTLLLVLFFLALAIPTSILVYQAYGQLKWEAFYQHQRLARELALRIDSGFRDLIEREENRPISDYEFLNVTGSGENAFLQRSPLSEFPSQADMPGLLGYFQVDASGRLRTPLVPGDNAAGYGISATELRQRESQEGLIRGILDQNRLVGKSDAEVASSVVADLAEEEVILEERSVAPSSAIASDTAELSIALESVEMDRDDSQGQAAFDELALRKSVSPTPGQTPVEQLEDLKLEDRYDVAAGAAPEAEPQEAKQQAPAKRSRKEKVALPQSISEQSLMQVEGEALQLELPASEPMLQQRAIRIQTFESEVEPMEFALLDSGHFVLFRRVWHQQERYIQGVLFDQSSFIDRLVAPAFRESSLSSMSRLIVAYQGAILRSFAADYGRQYRPSAEQEASELLYQSRLIAPFGDVELIFTLARLPVGAGGQVIIWSALILAIVLVGGCFMLLRLGQRQLALARQQQDFVSAVSHELKTPLTSIRMYGEMLREGWADESKRRSYYDFIFHEAERLTRLINNVLQLARMSRNEQEANLSSMAIEDVLAELKPRLESQLEPSAFELSISGDEQVGTARIHIDIDWFLQIFINLVDNAVKFSANAETRRVDIEYRRLRDGRIQFSVRDYGPGIAADQMKKIFRLFYRSENELTRETVGTGIGLALVQQLASAMQAEVDVVNAEPGAEFRIRFAAHD
ncbi:MAG: HAMP domain-containing histidine kinase [Gammaproteobacteria bacterium]|nr:MAG: HAMP domain-containing histidine kinase [Gammaproteobacteria bacterium]UCH39377.1 MAG: HAMP domain-containing histidine kinase [Gammaproteobacteria bacterium]